MRRTSVPLPGTGAGNVGVRVSGSAGPLPGLGLLDQRRCWVGVPLPGWHGCRWLVPVAGFGVDADRWLGTRCQVLVAWLEFVAGISTGAGTGGRAGPLSGPAALPELVRPASPVGQRRCWNGEARAGQRRCWASSGTVPDWRFGRSRVPGRMVRVELVAGTDVRAGIPKPGPALMLAPGLRCPTPGCSALVSFGIGQARPGHAPRTGSVPRNRGGPVQGAAGPVQGPA